MGRPKQGPKVRLRSHGYTVRFTHERRQREVSLKADTIEEAIIEAAEIFAALTRGEMPISARSTIARLTPLEPPTTGGVYAVRDARGYIKIGRAKNIADRLRNLRCANSGRLDLVAILAKDERLERKIHAQMKTWRASGEWFLPNAQLIELIRRKRGLY